MLKELRKEKLITNTAIREFESGEEIAHRNEFIRYLREIPDNFLSLAKNPNKYDLVKDHLRNFYMRKPENWEVDTVLDRVLNLALFAIGGRDSVEDKSNQHKFKVDNWRHAKRCSLCGEEFKTLDEVSLDHIIPLSLGGPEKPHNWQLTCKLCNVQKDQCWGSGDLSRIETFRRVQNNFFKLSEPDVLESLKAKSNPTRYWILERDLCKCSNCHLTSADEKLVIARRESGFLMTIDNLATYCLGCIKKKKLLHSK